MQQEHRPTAAVVFNTKANAISRNMMLRVPRRRCTCWNQQVLAFTTLAKRCLCQGSGGGQYTAKPAKERAPRIQGFSFTVTVHTPFFFSTSDILPQAVQPQFMTIERSAATGCVADLVRIRHTRESRKLSATSRGRDPIA
jgi:hypothetical protein